MQQLQAFKFELMPNGKQARDMLRFAGSCRFVYNKALAVEQERYKRGEKRLRYFGISSQLPVWRKELEWLADAPAQVLQQALKNLDRAYGNFFAKRTGFPKFKKKGMYSSFRYPQDIKLEQHNSRIYLPKLGWVRYRNSREVLGTVKNATVSRSNGRWYASIQTEREVETPVHPSESIVGLDMGITRFATMSDGSHVEPLNSFRKQEIRLRRYQRRMSRKKNFSKNWKKAKAKVQKIHTTIANCRKDFLHKTSTTISKNHAIVVVEDLKISDMSKSAAGTKAKPGRNVKAKSGLNKSILDQGWSEFRRQLGYKLDWLGGMLISVPPHNTSRTCPNCEHVSKENRKTQAKFECVECGYTNNADLVGALNVLARGHRVLACGEVPELRAFDEAGTRRRDSENSLNSVGISDRYGRGGCHTAKCIEQDYFRVEQFFPVPGTLIPHIKCNLYGERRPNFLEPK